MKKLSKRKVMKIACKVCKDLVKKGVIIPGPKEIKRKIKYLKTIEKIEKLSARPHGLMGWSNWEYEIDDIIDEEIKERRK